MFKFSLCFATLAGLIFLLRGDDDEKQEKKRKTDKVLTQDFDYDDYEDYEDFDYSDMDDIDVDDLDYDTLKEIELTLGNLGLGKKDRQDKSSKVLTDKKTKMEQDISNLRATLGGLKEAKQEVLTDEDLSRGYKVTNLQMLKNFEAPDKIESEDLLKHWKEEL